jgi:hypothetical protein
VTLFGVPLSAGTKRLASPEEGDLPRSYGACGMGIRRRHRATMSIRHASIPSDPREDLGQRRREDENGEAGSSTPRHAIKDMGWGGTELHPSEDGRHGDEGGSNEPASRGR